MRIRQCTVSDSGAIDTLMRQLISLTGDDFCTDVAKITAQLEHILRNNDRYDVFVAEDDNGRPVGFISVVYYQSFYHQNGSALVNELVVSASARGEGIGAALLKRAITAAEERTMDEIEVGVVSNNTDAVRFYRKNGFVDESLLLGKELCQ